MKPIYDLIDAKINELESKKTILDKEIEEWRAWKDRLKDLEHDEECRDLLEKRNDKR